jgi:hypothetical protein
MPAWVLAPLPAALAIPKSISFEVDVATGLVALVVRVVEPLADLHDDEAGLRDRHRLALRARAIEDRAHVTSVDVLERDVIAVVDDTEVEDLSDVRVVQLDRDLRLVDEHADELLVLRDVGQDPLDRDQPLEALHAVGLGAKHFGHAANIDSLEQVVLAEGYGLLHGPSRGAALGRPLRVGPYTN